MLRRLFPRWTKWWATPGMMTRARLGRKNPLSCDEGDFSGGFLYLADYTLPPLAVNVPGFGLYFGTDPYYYLSPLYGFLSISFREFK